MYYHYLVIVFSIAKADASFSYCIWKMRVRNLRVGFQMRVKVLPPYHGLLCEPGTLNESGLEATSKVFCQA
jgi:hypothetical protein